MSAQATVLAGLLGSPTHQLSVEIYQRHRGAVPGRCDRCGASMPCRARQHAMAVIEAAGEDPHGYVQGRDSGRQGDGYALGGRGRRAEVPFFPYER